jgi:hypothetical protein
MIVIKLSRYSERQDVARGYLDGFRSLNGYLCGRIFAATQRHAEAVAYFDPDKLVAGSVRSLSVDTVEVVSLTLSQLNDLIAGYTHYETKR